MDQLIIFYFLMSVLGWVWESIYCTLNRRAWQNRGFLYGPLCPIYGWGGLMAYLAYWGSSQGWWPQLNGWHVFGLGFIASMVLEYPTSWLLEKLFHARWWDYSNLPLNLQGRTSVPTSLAFGLGALLILYVLIPWYQGWYPHLDQVWASLLSYVLVGLHSGDLTLTITRLTDFQQRLDELEDALQSQMTERVDRLLQAQSSLQSSVIQRVVSFSMSERRNALALRIKEAKKK